MATSVSRQPLSIGQVRLADLFADGNDNALPADHRSQPERERNRNLNPWRNELGRVIQHALVVLEDRLVSVAYLQGRTLASGAASRW